jgi:transposase
MTDDNQSKKREYQELSNDQRKRVIETYKERPDIAQNKIAKLVGTSNSSISRVIRKYEDEGEVEKKKRGGSAKKLSEEQRETLRDWVDEDCKVTLKEMKEKVKMEMNVKISTSTIDNYLRDFHYTLKRTSLIPIKRNDPETIEKRFAYAQEFMQMYGDEKMEQKQFVFIDESGFNISMRSKYGRAKKGCRAVSYVKHLRSENISLCCAISTLGIIGWTARDTPYNSESFCEFLLQVMKNYPLPNCVFIFDNAQFHKTQAVYNTITLHGHRILPLPPYSPFLNPVENLFSQWKNFIRRQSPSTRDHLMSLFKQGEKSVTQHDCESYFRHTIVLLSTHCLERKPIEQD